MRALSAWKRAARRHVLSGMKLLVAPHDLAIGGSQINAIDLAAGAADAGHDVAVYGVAGPLVDHVAARGLEFVPARPLRYRPAPSRIAQLATLARRRRLDLIHAYEWPPCLDAYYGAHLRPACRWSAPSCRCRSRRWCPRSVPLIMGTDGARRRGAPDATWRPGLGAGAADRHRRGPARASTAARSARRTASAGRVAARRDRLAARDRPQARRARRRDRRRRTSSPRTAPVRLLIVGGGPAAAALEERAADVNARHAREVVRLCRARRGPAARVRGGRRRRRHGQLRAARDVDRPPGGGAGRARVLRCRSSPSTLPYFLEHGFYGIGASTGGGRRGSPPSCEPLLAGPARRDELGRFGRQTVEDRFSLPRARSTRSSRSTTRCWRSRPPQRAPPSGRRRRRARSGSRSTTTIRGIKRARARAARRPCSAPRAARRSAIAPWLSRGTGGSSSSARRTAGTTVSCADQHMAERLDGARAGALRRSADLAPHPLQQPGGRRLAQAAAPAGRSGPRLARLTPIVPPKPAHPAMPPASRHGSPAASSARPSRSSADRWTPSSPTWLFTDAYGVCGEQPPRVLVAGRPGRRAPPLGRRAPSGSRRPSDGSADASDLIVAVNEAAVARWIERGHRQPPTSRTAATPRSSRRSTRRETPPDVDARRPDRRLRRPPQQPDRPRPARGGRGARDLAAADRPARIPTSSPSASSASRRAPTSPTSARGRSSRSGRTSR